MKVLFGSICYFLSGCRLVLCTCGVFEGMSDPTKVSARIGLIDHVRTSLIAKGEYHQNVNGVLDYLRVQAVVVVMSYVSPSRDTIRHSRPGLGESMFWVWYAGSWLRSHHTTATPEPGSYC